MAGMSDSYQEEFASNYRLKTEKGQFKGIMVHRGAEACNGRESPVSATISPDNRELTVTEQRMFELDADFKRDRRTWPCVLRPRPEERFVLRKE